MYHGGTHFGFIAGSNEGNGIEPVPTSYDYDAPISEAGDLTQKFFDIKNVIKKAWKLYTVFVCGLYNNQFTICSTSTLLTLTKHL